MTPLDTMFMQSRQREITKHRARIEELRAMPDDHPDFQKGRVYGVTQTRAWRIAINEKEIHRIMCELLEIQ